ncbi:right-handed parallel beta-helix repeat-containing protein [Fusibacter ferrireducens]|uniref:Right-handed parallel beta-helix repeat-containing protein n=1 Tax=Fusibacter ferrireducens TaxID=2785058 RepID=A0ABR9ZT36_9FIRM|nr:right-handed parallel beta-helix repeat-containing protein [Fusibacter ferrireducens]MBF4693608.1 right-handed parallel beta-helix repeat-containing protein [Fusibacter ferrireducens]
MVSARLQKNFIIAILCIVCMSFIVSGCSKDNSKDNLTDKGDVIPNKGDVIQASELNLKEFFHFNLDETLYYNGVPDLNRYESCVRIDEIISPNTGKLYYFEGDSGVSTDDITGDYAFYKAYKVTDKDFTIYYDDQNEMILLKNDISEGDTWQTSMIDPKLGMLEVQATVKSIEKDEITVMYEFADQQNIPEDLQYTLEYVFKSGQGIVKERQVYKDSNLELNLTQKSSAPPNTFVSRYSKPSELISKIYSDTYFQDLISDAVFKQKIRTSQFEDNDLYENYENYLDHLQASDMKRISRGKEMLQTCMIYTEKPLRLVRQFVEFYELSCYDNGRDWIDQLKLYDLDQFDELFIYSESAGKLVVNSHVKGELHALGAYLVENGLSIEYEEGFPYFSPSAEFIDRAVSVDDPLVQDYLSLKELQYNFFPIQSDGYLMVSADELANAIKAFDADYQAHRDLEDFKEAKYLADYLFELYILPNDYFIEGYNYAGGYIADEYLSSYKTYIKENPKSSYTPILINIEKLLNENNHVYSKALNNYLIELGYTPDDLNFSQRFKQMEAFSKITDGKKRILLNPEASESVKVSNTAEFLAAIGPDKTIYLKPGLYTLPYDLEIDNEYVEIEEGTLRIKNVKNMTVLSESGIVDVIADSYLEVLIVDGCENIQLDGIRLGHLREYCVGDVLAIKASKNVEINRVILFGCGYNGLNLDQVVGVSLSNSLISDCQACGLVFEDADKITVENTQFYRNGRQVFDFKNATHVTLTQVVAEDNDKEAYEDVEALMLLDERSDVLVESSKLDTTFVKKLVEGKGILTQEN